MVRRLKTDLHNCVGFIQEPKLLKDSIKAMYQKHVNEDMVSKRVNFVPTFSAETGRLRPYYMSRRC